jgi:enamine deaminase RidA (YjgF/YER057c/UK114 family)
MKDQAAEVLKCIDGLLSRAGTDKTRILSALVFVTDLSEFSLFNEVWDAWVLKGEAPARATTQVTKLADPNWKLEIVITAALP